MCASCAGERPSAARAPLWARRFPRPSPACSPANALARRGQSQPVRSGQVADVVADQPVLRGGPALGRHHAPRDAQVVLPRPEDPGQHGLHQPILVVLAPVARPAAASCPKVSHGLTPCYGAAQRRPRRSAGPATKPGLLAATFRLLRRAIPLLTSR